MLRTKNIDKVRTVFMMLHDLYSRFKERFNNEENFFELDIAREEIEGEYSIFVLFKDRVEKFYKDYLDRMDEEMRFNNYTLLSLPDLTIASRVANHYYNRDIRKILKIVKSNYIIYFTVSKRIKNDDFYVLLPKHLPLTYLQLHINRCFYALEYCVNYFQQELKECDIIINKEESNTIPLPRKNRKIAIRDHSRDIKLIWKSKPIHLTRIIDVLIDKGYLSFPNGNREKKRNAEILLEIFSFPDGVNPTVDSLRQSLHDDNTVQKKPFNSIPHKDNL